MPPPTPRVRPKPSPKPQTTGIRAPLPTRPAPPRPQPQPVRYFAVQSYDNGWWRAVDEQGAQVWREGMPGITWPITGCSAKRVRERMAAEMVGWQERSEGCGIAAR